jgi:hypothetical protein
MNQKDSYLSVLTSPLRLEKSFKVFFSAALKGGEAEFSLRAVPCLGVCGVV